MKQIGKPKRQGDVLVIPVDKIPAGKKTTRRVTLALGEKTGHHHSIAAGAVGFADDAETVAEFVEVREGQGVTLRHQEHNPIPLGPGKYRSVIQSEYTPQAIRRVTD